MIPSKSNAALLFFSIMSSYYVLRIIRDEIGIRIGIEQMVILFSISFLGWLILTPLLAWAFDRWPIKKLIQVVLGVLLLMTIVFYWVLLSGFALTFTHILFFVWVGQYNLLIVSLFWAYLGDRDGKKTILPNLGFILAAGSLAAIIIPFLIKVLAPSIGVLNLLLLSIFFQAHSLILITLKSKFGSWARVVDRGYSNKQKETGVAWSGLKSLIPSGPIQGIGIYVLFYSSFSTFLYFEQAQLLTDQVLDSIQRVEYFATVDLLISLIAFLVQLLFTTYVLQHKHPIFIFCSIPILLVVGFWFLQISPSLIAIGTCLIILRAGNFALLRPAKEWFFININQRNKHQAKNFIDTTLVRGGNTLSAWLFLGLGSMGTGGLLTYLSIPLAGLWIINGFFLGSQIAKNK